MYPFTKLLFINNLGSILLYPLTKGLFINNLMQNSIFFAEGRSSENAETPPEKRSIRTNPLMRLNTDGNTSKTSPSRRRTTHHGSKTTTTSTTESNHQSSSSSPKKVDEFDTATTAMRRRPPHEREKRVSFENTVLERTEAVEKQQQEEEVPLKKQQEEEQEEQQPIELCDIEPISGTVFRKVTVRRRRQEMRKVAAVDTGMSFFLAKLTILTLQIIASVH